MNSLQRQTKFDDFLDEFNNGRVFRNTWDLNEVQIVDRQNGYYEVELKLVPQSDSSVL